MMANKENLPPRHGGSSPLSDDRSTPPANIPATLGICHWQHAAYAAPPFGLLSPSSKPSLARQRDHSACRAADSPLKVRKTRENLKQPSIIGDIPPPCMHTSPYEVHDCRPTPTLSFTSATTLNSSVGDVIGMGEQHELTGTTLASAVSLQESALPVSPPLQVPGKILRHKSVSRRMLSKVKEGITSRSRSSHSMRPADSDSGVMRRFSSKRKQSGEEQRRLQSFEISRNSIDSEDAESASATQRSFTDSSISTDELIGTLNTLTPPPAIGLEMGPRRASSALLPPSPTPTSSLDPQSPSGEPTPRAPARDSVLGCDRVYQVLQAAVPFVDLKIHVDRESIDVGVSREMWVAVEATVRTKVAEASSFGSTKTSQLRSQAIDVVLIVTEEALASETTISQQCIVELCSRLDLPGDRLAVLVAKSQRLNATTISCECAEVHALQSPRTAALLDRLGFTPSTARISLADNSDDWQPLQFSLTAIVDQGLHKDNAHAFVIAQNPEYLLKAISENVQWPAHAVKVGLTQTQQVPNSRAHAQHWAIDLKGEGELSTDTFDNMFRDIRHDYHMGSVPSLRLCYKAIEGCQITEIVGEKAMRDMKLGQRCSLFIRVKVPKINTEPVKKHEADQDSLFTELESIVGTLETNYLHVEARYRHTALPTESVVTLREICSIKRPKSESRWSLVAGTDKSTSEQVHAKLARALATHYHPAKALKLIDRWELANSKRVLQVRRYLELQAKAIPGGIVAHVNRSPSPAVVVTDTDMDHSRKAEQGTPQVMPRTASAATLAARQPSAGTSSKLPHSASSQTIIARRTISPPKITTAIIITDPTSPNPADFTNTSRSRENSPTDANDSARQIWHHIRRNSLPAKQMLEMSPDKLQQLESLDPALKELREKALANKRSIGAETLKGWKWDGMKEAEAERKREAPWL